MVENNPHKISTMGTADGSSLAAITDASDFPHTGLIKGLSLMARQNIVVKGSNDSATHDFNITQATSGNVIQVAQGSYLRDGKLYTASAANFTIGTTENATSLLAHSQFDAGYHLLVIDSTNTIKIRQPVADNKVPDYTSGDTIIAIIEITSIASKSDGSRLIQYLTSDKTSNSVSIAYDASNTYTEVSAITGTNAGLFISGIGATGAAAAADDKVIIQDTSASDVIKSVTAQAIANLAPVGTVTSVSAGTGMTQSGTSTVNPTLNVIGGTGITANANDIAITAGGVGTTQLADEGVTYAKMQHISASPRVLGRISSNAGDVEELTSENLKTIVGDATTDLHGLMTDTQFDKLAGIAASANNYVHPDHSGEVTSSADGATVIADNVVDEANLKVSNAPTNGYFLSAQSGNTGGLTWAAGGGGSGDITSVVAGTGLTGGATTGAATLNVIGGTGITANANDIAIDSTVATLSGSQTLTNKTIAVSQITELSNLTAVEGAQLENIGSVTISNAQWGYLGAATGAIGSGDITSVVAGNGLTGGGTTGDVTLVVGVDDSTIEINSDALRIKDGGIVVGKMAANSVDSDQYVDASIDADHLAADAVITAKILNANVTTAKIADDAVTGAKLANDIDIAGTLDVTGITTLDNNLIVSGVTTLRANVLLKATAFSATIAESGTVYQLTNAGAVVVTLPADPTIGCQYVFVNVNGNNMVITPTSGDIINGTVNNTENNATAYAATSCVCVVGGGTAQWLVFGGI